MEATHLQRTSRAPELHTSTSARRQRTPKLHLLNYNTFTSAHLLCAVAVQTRLKYPSFAINNQLSQTPSKFSSIPFSFHAKLTVTPCSETPDLQSSNPPRRYTYIEPPDLRACMPPYLYGSAPSRRYTYVNPLDLHASTSAHRQRDSRAPYIHTSMPPRLHVGYPPPALYTSIPPYLHISTSLDPQHASTSTRLQRAVNQIKGEHGEKRERNAADIR